MKCNFRNEKIHPVCTLGMYGGMPSFKMCELCVSHKENTREFALQLKTKFEKSHPETASNVSGCCDSAKNYT